MPPPPPSSVRPPPPSVDDVRSWTEHVIVCGMHDVALRTVEQLRLAGLRVVVVDDQPEPRLVALIDAWGVPYLARSPVAEGTFDAVGLRGAAAVICAGRSDLLTLEAALEVRNLRPGVRVVVHLDNPGVGGAVEGVTGEGSVLDVAGLFAPSVIDVCLGRGARDLDLAGRRFVAASLVVPRAATLRELYGDLAPIGVLQGDEDHLVACPGRDQGVATGDRVTVVGTPQEFAASGVDPEPPGEGRATGPRRLRRRAGAAARHALDHLDGPVRATLWAGLAVLVVSTVVLRAFYVIDDGPGAPTHMTWVEALYFSVETSATVGFGDFSFADETWEMQIFAIGLIIAGTAFVSLLFAFITNALVSRRIEASLGRAPVRGVEDHVILIGLGSVGIRVLEGLRERGCEVVVVERDEDNRYASQARLLGVRVIVGDATLARTLDAANIVAARAVAIMTSDDMTNIETGLAVRERLGERWTDVPVVLRVFDRGLGRRLEESFEFRHVWSTAAIAAPWFVGAAIGMRVLATFYVGATPFLVARLTIRPGGGLDGAAMERLTANVRVLALGRGGDDAALEHPPRRDTRFSGGDHAYLAGPYEELMAVVRADRPAAG